MGMQRGRVMMKYLSIPVLILGLFLTFLLDLALYHEDSRMSRDVLTATASHKLNRFYDYLNRYMTAAEVIGSMIDEKNGTIYGMGEHGRTYENRSLHPVYSTGSPGGGGAVFPGKPVAGKRTVHAGRAAEGRGS